LCFKGLQKYKKNRKVLLLCGFKIMIIDYEIDAT